MGKSRKERKIMFKSPFSSEVVPGYEGRTDAHRIVDADGHEVVVCYGTDENVDLVIRLMNLPAQAERDC